MSSRQFVKLCRDAGLLTAALDECSCQVTHALSASGPCRHTRRLYRCAK
jgi:hypothetical protein